MANVCLVDVGARPGPQGGWRPGDLGCEAQSTRSHLLKPYQASLVVATIWVLVMEGLV